MSYKTYRTYTKFIGLLAISYLLFAGVPVHAATDVTTKTIEIGPFCFRKAECASYNAIVGPKDPLCTQPSPGHSQKAVDFDYQYACYAKPPKVKLQVSVGGYEVEGIDQYIKRLYIFLVGISSLVAGIMIVWAGVKWLTSAGSPDKITDAKHKIGNALIGLVLVLGSYVILQTINPALVSLRLPPVKIVRPAPQEVEKWCVNREEFKCGGDPNAALGLGKDGQYSCSEEIYIKKDNPPCSGGPAAGSCFGQWCAQGGCNRTAKSRITSAALDIAHATPLENYLKNLSAEKRICVDPAWCDCSALNTKGPQDLGGNAMWDVCISTACKCVLNKDQANIVCTRQKHAGESCNTDEVCESGNCNFAYGDTCTPIGGEPQGRICAEDEDCAAGLLCNKGGADARCQPPLPGGGVCKRDKDCKSKNCSFLIGRCKTK